MTKENRENQYKHFRDLEKNYVAAVGRDHDLERTDVLRKRARESADAMLKLHPELSEFDEKKEEEAIPKEKPIETPVDPVTDRAPTQEEKPKTKSKGKK